MYKVVFLKSFDKSYQRLLKGNNLLEKRTVKAVQLLSIDPFYPSLKSHNVNTRRHGTKWSSRVTDDIRLIWDFDNNNRLLIDILDIGTHSGRHGVYL
ncbi:hypothetical protein CO051_05915 [Candidatus Roizmanbacteria bacterium CG_4_9_14_0_2_um_filter_39_13]|uniref:Type II toxin-antitoxin system mRNA interferase toxin, RelE/StbE family n=2 Tax=Candidatus Roizmaniibacteriota TaxID=1752723 RepID=A0A2M8EX09_9BACT|nr:MAG: hypothetical protein COY15_04590 [Candidatus Roizmanbacteria bacterium CG_4_10_14_0_2_um_filter_39_12]PJC30400.1 MAG: hypothetical protein CO051_05915 [Candidatus Roizmanbacteria bacterium CG_4_9_14_0_2_um_filter_39_13]PJE61474.1 MAG: hypothetical protein COU87_04255 [Candidatus Roizmanbacteria bacterium CG10_big_fil_rev_8_21_14_0_10_39_12]